MTKKLIFAHRGGTENYRQNSLDAIKDSLKSEADAVEFDVRTTSDGIYIIHHNPRYKERKISGLTFSELRRISDSQVPKLEDALKALGGKIKIDVDLKEKGRELDIVIRVLKNYDPKKVMVTTRNPKAIKQIKEKYPKLETGLIFGRLNFTGRLPNPFRTLSGYFPTKVYKESKADFVVAPYELTSQLFLRAAQKADAPLYIWKCDTPRTVRNMLRNNRVAGIITDIPRKAREIQKSI